MSVFTSEAWRSRNRTITSRRAFESCGFPLKMSLMMSLKVFLSERLAAAADEIFGAVEKTIFEYKEEISRSKDLEISRLRMQLKPLKSEPVDRCLSAQLQQQHTPHLHPPTSPPPPPPEQHQQSSPAEESPEAQPCQEDEGRSLEQEHPEPEHPELEHPEPPQVKKEQHGGHRDFWIADDEEQLGGLESDIKDLISSPASLKAGLHDRALPFHPYHPYQHLHLHHHLHNSGDENKDKPFCCSVCEKRFSNCSHLAAHIRTHTGERPYRCEICRKTFITTSALNRHQTIHTEGKQFVCNFCGKSFKWMESLARHTRSIHKRDNVPVWHCAAGQ